MGVAVLHALRAIVPGVSPLALKWPNDILYGKAKLAGILLEGTRLTPTALACVAGVGINCQAHPADVPYETTDLTAVSGQTIDPRFVFERLSDSIPRWLDVWAGGSGFASIRAEWLTLAAGVGSRIRVARPSSSVEGVFSTIDCYGRLVIERSGDFVTIEAGDVFLDAACKKDIASDQGVGAAAEASYNASR